MPANAESRARTAERAVSGGSSLRVRLRDAWARLKGGELAPWRAAASVTFGLAIGSFAYDLALGTAVFSPAVALAGGALTYVLARKWRRSHSPKGALDAALLRAGDRYGGAPGHYVRAKIASDPVVREVASIGDLGEVVDVGCGRGQMLVVLLETARATRGVGFDWDAAKIEIARAAAAGLPATFESGDLLVHAIATCDTVLLVDVLHYLTDAEQDALLGRAAASARRRVVVRELDPDRGWRSVVGRVQEAITTRLGINRGARIRLRPVSAITSALEARGFTVSVAPCWGATPFANVLIVGTKTPA